jgi:hypothetical protein
MTDALLITLLPRDEIEAGTMRRLIEQTLQEEGALGFVSIMVLAEPAVLQALGVDRLPAVVIGDQVVLQGRPPNRSDVKAWCDMSTAQSKPAPARAPDRARWPSSVEEAVAGIVEAMSEEDKAQVLAADEQALVLANGPFGWGQGIRNGFGLWTGNRALLTDCGSDHPDDASLVIIRAVQERLRRTGRR